jgi:hypothetical protein
MVSWGIVTICTAACTTYGGLMACRVFLGIAEAGENAWHILGRWPELSA